ncbi:MAG: hypothetical protein NZ772_18015, partial [Cyanobacteria bacterium]|nr:hypothetical protein [Cyanobacteriota bacterium]MDW8203173.1 hypothetical protein [Cyanobacteriota bacterium SKYGB_h_bin112]
MTAELIKILRRIAALDGFEYRQFATYLEQYQADRCALLATKPNATEQIQQLDWHCEVIRACWQGFQCSSIEELCGEITGLLLVRSPSSAGAGWKLADLLGAIGKYGRKPYASEIVGFTHQATIYKPAT